mgnify:FL=1
MTEPPAGFDSCRNGARDYYVIFNPDYILPVALVEYTMHVEQTIWEDALDPEKA